MAVGDHVAVLPQVLLSKGDNNCSSHCEIGVNWRELIIAAALFTAAGRIRPISVSQNDKVKLTGKKILCRPFSLLGGVLKRPLDGLRNHMRWTPPLSSPRSNREGCSGH